MVIRPGFNGKFGRVKFIANAPFNLIEKYKSGNINALNDYVLDSVPLYFALFKDIAGKKKYLNLELDKNIELSNEPRTFIEPILIDIDFHSRLVNNLNQIFLGITLLPEMNRGLKVEEYSIEEIKDKYNL